MTKKEIIKFIILYLCIFIGAMGLMVYTLSPELSDFRNSVYGDIIFYSFMGGTILYLTLSKRIDMPFLGKITVWGYALLFIIFAILDFGKKEAVVFLIYSVVNIIVTIYLYLNTGKAYSSIWGFGALAYLSIIMVVFRVKYINGEMNSTLLSASIVFAVLAFITCLIYAIIRYDTERDKQNLIAIPLLGLLGGFVLTYLTVGAMNVYLDFSAPIHEEYVIVDKDVRTGARQITTYEFKVQKDESTFFIGVSEESFYDHEINDKITLSIYSGAFNEPYYIYENNGD